MRETQNERFGKEKETEDKEEEQSVAEMRDAGGWFGGGNAFCVLIKEGGLSFDDWRLEDGGHRDDGLVWIEGTHCGRGRIGGEIVHT